MAWLAPTDDSALADMATRTGTVRSNKTPRNPCTPASPPLVCSPEWKHRLPAPINVFKVNSITGFCYLRRWVVGRCWLGCNHGLLFRICSLEPIRNWKTQSMISECQHLSRMLPWSWIFTEHPVHDFKDKSLVSEISIGSFLVHQKRRNLEHDNSANEQLKLNRNICVHKMRKF